MRYIKDYSNHVATLEVLRQTEIRLSEQQAMASASDRRSLGHVALSMAVIAYLAESSRNEILPKIDAIALLLFLFSVVLSALSARPVRFYGSGSSSKELDEFLESNVEGYLVHALIIRNDVAISKNDNRIKTSAKIFLVSLIASFAGLLLLTSSSVFPMFDQHAATYQE